MTGYEVNGVRGALGLDAFAFARLLGVNVATVYRWEAHGQWTATMDPLHGEILTRTVKHVATMSNAQLETLGEDIRQALIRGPLNGLAALLRVLVGS